MALRTTGPKKYRRYRRPKKRKEANGVTPIMVSDEPDEPDSFAKLMAQLRRHKATIDEEKSTPLAKGKAVAEIARIRSELLKALAGKSDTIEVNG